MMAKGWGTRTASLKPLLAFFPLGHNGCRQRGNDRGEPQHPPLNIHTEGTAQQTWFFLHVWPFHIYFTWKKGIYTYKEHITRSSPKWKPWITLISQFQGFEWTQRASSTGEVAGQPCGFWSPSLLKWWGRSFPLLSQRTTLSCQIFWILRWQ